MTDAVNIFEHSDYFAFSALTSCALNATWLTDSYIAAGPCSSDSASEDTSGSNSADADAKFKAADAKPASSTRGIRREGAHPPQRVGYEVVSVCISA